MILMAQRSELRDKRPLSIHWLAPSLKLIPKTLGLVLYNLLPMSYISLAIDCGPVPRPQNGLIFFSGTTFGLMVAYSCNTGYELLGVSERTCQEDGLWSDSAPTCARKHVICMSCECHVSVM